LETKPLRNRKKYNWFYLKGFAQTETVVNDYWTGLVTKWFRKPEIIMMATTFGAMETIHAEAYSLLNETLGLDDFSEFLEDETTMAKIENLMSVRDSFNGEKNWHEIAKSLAIFSPSLKVSTSFLHSPYYSLSKCETDLREWVKLLNGLLETKVCTQKRDVGYLEHLSRKTLSSRIRSSKQP
jgi:ribonucleotide reductase beta subunit family protein with ferritin-like domain